MATTTVKHGQLSQVDEDGNVLVLQPENDGTDVKVDRTANTVGTSGASAIPSDVDNVQKLVNKMGALAFKTNIGTSDFSSGVVTQDLTVTASGKVLDGRVGKTLNDKIVKLEDAPLVAYQEQDDGSVVPPESEINDSLTSAALTWSSKKLSDELTQLNSNHQNDINSLNQSINVERSRIDNLLTAETLDENSELIDIRTGYDGTIYDSAGNAVRSQVNELKDEIIEIWKPLHLDNLLVKKQNLYSSFLEHKNGYWTRGGYNENATFHTVLVPVVSGKTYTINHHFDYLYLFDLNYNSATAERVGTGGTLSENRTITIPSGVCMVAIIYRTNVATDLSTLMVVEGDTIPSEYVSGEPQWRDDIGFAPTEKNIGILFNKTPVEIVRNDNKSTVTIKNSSVVFSRFGNMTTPNVTTTIEFTSANFLAYDVNTKEFFAGATRNGHNTIIIGFINHASTRTDVCLQCNYTYDDKMTDTDRRFGYVFMNPHPSLRKTENGCILTMNQCSIMTKDGAINGIEKAEIECTGIVWLSYDMTDGQYVTTATKAGHKLIVLGYINPSDFESCYISGTDIEKTKSIAFLGDSNTAGSGTLKPYHVQLKSAKRWICKNYGYGGSGYLNVAVGNTGLYGTGQEGIGETINTSTGKYIAENDFYHRIDSIDTNVDALVIWGGTNDWGGGFTKEQFREGVRNVLEKAENRFTNVPIVVMTPIHRADEVGTDGEYKQTVRGLATLPDFVDVILDECSRKGIPCVDLFRRVNIDPHNANMNARFFARDDKTMNDGLHPNKYAHERIMHMLLSELEKQFITSVI